MRNLQAQIRKLIFDQSFLIRNTLDNAIGGTSVQLTNKILLGQSYPYIYVRSNSSESTEVNRDAYGSDNIITFEVHTRSAKSAGGDKECNLISDNLMNQIITRGNNAWFNNATGFKIYSVELENITFIQDQRSDHYYVRSIIDINFKTMEN